MGREEQEEERVVLDSIFPDEITDLDEHSYRIQVGLELPGPEGEEGTQATILLTVQLPEAYPTVAPNLSLSHPVNEAKPASLDLADDGPGLLAALEPTIEESLGDAMVFNLVTALKDAAEQLCGERAQAVQAERDAERAEAEARENAKFHGERVTRDSFLEWRDRFVVEMAAAEEQRRADEADAATGRKGAAAAKAAAKEDDKLTGRQLWEKGMVGKGWEDEEEGAPALEKGVEALRVDN